ncbi:TetR/AcrR family transcriptional regulator [Jeotgalibacillus sp. R-1-5s-1]|uniref:TetR/AcrR family transcriptional regulator n=1 Tax=Jeotgalibacillus sp. R-1-5s-1 TaxID=2555897 RepID=UPI0010698232|nr:TetR/AcrR family transcriptional regulator [Jeotgalibacillus sp. R-1-5s-1]TFD97682.1 TetR/AcrR family transcriptional regulator [Jeotgalibacillus sp. R-1-5s-1]
MARQRKMDMEELMEATENLLLEKGYEGFHFKALSENLNVARSTIYEYYKNKDELITDYMNILMEQVMRRIRSLADQPSSFLMLKELLILFMEYSQVYDMIKMRPSLDQNASPHVKEQLKKLDAQSRELFQILLVEIEKAKNEGSIRKDLPTSLIAGVFFNTVLIQNTDQIPPREWADLLFSLIEDGIKPKD